MSLMVDASESGLAYSAAIIDQSVINMEAEQFSSIVQQDEGIATVPLILLSSTELSQKELRRLENRYSSIMSQPLDKPLLFNAIHAAISERELDENVITLSEYYGRTNSAKELNILVAEDNDINKKVIQGILGRAGHHVHMVSDGDEALEALTAEDTRYDIAILDMNMPKRSGIDVLKAYRFIDTTSSMPVMMVTADATLETMNACMDAGADAYITKPIDAHGLLESIAGLVGKNGINTKHLDTGSNNENTIEFSRDSVLNQKTLDSLTELGSGIEFVKDLIRSFSHDSKSILTQADQAVADMDYLGFREALHALKGSAAELGAVEFVHLCNKAERLKAYEMPGPLPRSNLTQINNAHSRLLNAMQQYLSQQRSIK